MRLLERLLREVGSQMEVGEVYRLGPRRFKDPVEEPLDLPGLVYTGFYLGRTKRRFQPSSLLLQHLAKEDHTHKAYVDRRGAWLFLVGKDLFEESLLGLSEGARPGRCCLVVYGGRCLGYGRLETRWERRVVTNLFNLGDFLHRESQ